MPFSVPGPLCCLGTGAHRLLTAPSRLNARTGHSPPWQAPDRADGYRRGPTRPGGPRRRRRPLPQAAPGAGIHCGQAGRGAAARWVRGRAPQPAGARPQSARASGEQPRGEPLGLPIANPVSTPAHHPSVSCRFQCAALKVDEPTATYYIKQANCDLRAAMERVRAGGRGCRGRPRLGPPCGADELPTCLRWGGCASTPVRRSSLTHCVPLCCVLRRSLRRTGGGRRRCGGGEARSSTSASAEAPCRCSLLHR